MGDKEFLRFLPWISFFLITLLVLSCARVVYPPGRMEFGPPQARWVRKTLARMSVEEKIGQMIAWRYSGYFVNRQSEYFRELEKLIVKRGIGGLIIFGGNVYETAMLTNAFQRLARIPLLIASDFERGAGNQIRGAIEFPPLMAMGATRSEEFVYLMGKITALEGRAMGIHMTYAPVVDVNINPENPIINTRSFGEDPELVSRLAKAFIKGCQENGLIATAKHYPGHGDTDLDSHSYLPTVRGDLERLERVELYPFRKAVEAGVQAVMTAHLYVPALDPTPQLPATLSKNIITDILRKKFGFKGLIVTDSMGMGGITKHYEPEEAAIMAVKAGVDMVLLPPETEKVIEALIEAVKGGKISERRVDASVRRILEAKARLGLRRNKLVNIDLLERTIAVKERIELADKMFESSITLVKNKGDILPLKDLSKQIAVFSLSSDLGDYFAGRTFVNEVTKRCEHAVSFYADRFTGEEFLEEAVEKAKNADIALVALFSSLRAWKGSVDLEPRHVEVVEKLVGSRVPVVAVSFGSPYFLRHFPEVDSYLCAYRNAAPAQKAAVRAIFGEIDVSGKLPVSLPGLFCFGHGLTIERND
ncbi:MAG: glycoside hydrolase family 3 protein [Candidatus Aminicenantales bacterium]